MFTDFLMRTRLMHRGCAIDCVSTRLRFGSYSIIFHQVKPPSMQGPTAGRSAIRCAKRLESLGPLLLLNRKMICLNTYGRSKRASPYHNFTLCKPRCRTNLGTPLSISRNIAA